MAGEPDKVGVISRLWALNLKMWDQLTPRIRNSAASVLKQTKSLSTRVSTVGYF